MIPANSNFSPTTNINVVECAAPGGVIPTDPATCDGNTINGLTLKPAADGSINYQTYTHGKLYPIYSIPNPALSEGSSGPACDVTDECMLFIGYNQNDFTQPHYWSQPFYVSPNALNNGANPGDGTETATTTTLSGAPTSSSYGQSVTLTATVTNTFASDTVAPTGTVTFSDGSTVLGTGALNGGGTATLTTSSLPTGTDPLSAAYAGTASIPGSTSATLNYVVAQDATSTSLSASPPSTDVVTAPVTLTATVTPASSGALAPTGSVTFKDGGTTLGTSPLSGGKATLTTSTLAIGSHGFTASYSGDTNYAASGTNVASPLPYTVTIASATGTLSSSANPSAPGQSVTFTDTLAPVAPATAIPTGSVTFKDGTTTLGTSPVTAGKATLTATGLVIGTHPITAVYSGDANFSGVTSSLSQVVNKIATVLTGTSQISISPLAIILPAVQATLKTAGGAPLAGMTITFTAGSTLLCSAVTNGAGTATCTPPTLDEVDIILALGVHETYAGNATYFGSSASTSIIQL